MKNRKFSIHKGLESFSFAFNGLLILFRKEHNARIHFVAALVVIVAGIIFRITAFEWLALVFVIGLVLALEAINSAIENLADFVSPHKHDQIKKVKDLAAAGVLIAAATALIAGLLIFLPKIQALFITE
ncbi:diacylglycerol kinase family protein [Maribellus luteus]|uniref:Diacylglycerol kinase family protein n=1 Tax=Maribellus luteus TaxID=2305463 RepID=A0A399T2U5_9BACT|nr:diacylglycerol kinase family protein [Maribellus luteus]RIJ50138.1 diacylglycerol kinase family protein [Maribellus luteus]